jgi:hypothetical protein
MEHLRYGLRAGAILLLIAVSSTAQIRAHTEIELDDAYLDALRGRWEMTGTMLGKPARYRAYAERVLQGGFLRLHMIDAAQPPQYEADFYVGFDRKAGDFVGHWLDKFGAAGARIVATGKRDGEILILQFPYAEGAFRDTFKRDAKHDSWSLLIEAQAANGAWSNFANYAFARQHTQAPKGSSP